jgi:hypothetical protein
MNSKSCQRYPALRASFGASRWDITPDLNVCSKNWGAAAHWFADGVHRELTGTAIAIAGLSENAPPLLLISLELGWWRSRGDADRFRQQLLDELELPEENLILHLTHTHSGPILDSEAPRESSPETARAYLALLVQSCATGAREAIQNRHPATALFNCGRCSLAKNRDLPDPQRGDRYLCGFQPEAPADDTLLVGRIVLDDGRTLATLVNYACHPTTLAWENHSISPDYPGAMRALVEGETNGAPCMFLFGASGDLAPAEQYTGDTSLADRHGRELGYAAMAALAPLERGLPALRFEGCVESGAPLAVWKASSHPSDGCLRASAPNLTVEVKHDLPTIEAIDAAIAAKPEGFQYERLLRQRRVRASIGNGTTSVERIWLWRLGDALLCATPFEAYSDLQLRIRRELPNRPVFTLNIGNGSLGYLPPRPLYDHNIYQVWQTPFARGTLEQVIDAAIVGLRELSQD